MALHCFLYFLSMFCIAYADTQFWIHKFDEKAQSEIQLWNSSYFSDEVLKLNELDNNQVGRALYKEALIECNSKYKSSSFSSNFTFLIHGGKDRGDGFVFFVTPKFEGSPADSIGKWFGLTNTNINAKNQGQFVAVEFDTYQNSESPWSDINNNHVGIDVVNTTSIKAYNLSQAGLDLRGGYNMTAWVDYHGSNKTLDVCVSNSSSSFCSKPLISVVVDICGVLNATKLYAGLGSGTEGGYEYHDIYSWGFWSDTHSTPSPSPNPSSATLNLPLRMQFVMALATLAYMIISLMFKAY